MKKSISNASKVDTNSSASKLTFSVIYTYEDFYSALTNYFSSFKFSKKRKNFDKAFVWLLGIFLISTNSFDLYHKFNWSETFGIVLGLLFFVPLNYFHKLNAFITFFISKLFMPIKFSIDDYGVTYKGKFFPKTKVKWSTFNRFIISENKILLVRPLIQFPMIELINYIPKRSIEESDWKKFINYIKYRENILVTTKQPNRLIRWSIRVLFIILIELCLWFGYIDIILFFQYDIKTPPFATLLVLLMIFLPFYSKWIEFRRYSLKKNLLFPLVAFAVLTILFIGLVLLDIQGYH